MFSSGVCSISFRELEVAEIVSLAAECGLEGIEWGGDVHVRPGDMDAAKRALGLTREAGLCVSSYGSYFFVGEENRFSFGDVVETALRLETGLIRIWPARILPEDVSPADFQRVVDESRRIGDVAAEQDLEVAFEFHQGGLTEGNDAAVRLLSEVDHPSVGIYWQPCHGMPMEYHLEGIERLRKWLKFVHVFHWLMDGESILRRPLSEGTDAWNQFLRAADLDGFRQFALLEFVLGDDVGQFREDAGVLRELIDR